MSTYVLIVDDNPSDLLITSALVSSQGGIGVEAKDGFEALAKLNEFNFSFLIIDLQMARMPGIDLIKRIRTIEKYRKVPIVVQSGRREASDVRIALQVGANDYLVKPSDPLIFEEKFKRLLGREARWTEYELSQVEGSREAMFGENVELHTISEVGLTFYYHQEVEAGSNRLIAAEILMKNEIGVLPISVRRTDKINGKYLVKASFVGLSENVLKKIRLFCQWVYRSQIKKELL